MKIRNKTFTKILKFVVIPALLLIFWLFSYLFFNETVSFSVLEYPHTVNSFSDFDTGKLLLNHNKSAQITAEENNFGIMYVRFSKFFADYQKTETLYFKIKEKGQKNWYFTNEYKIGYLEDGGYFPFGFPSIKNSKNKSYVFEIGASTVNRKNLVEIDPKNPVIFAAYQFPKSELLSNKKNFPIYLLKKILNSVTRVDLIFSSLIYAIPFFVYLVWLRLSRRAGAKTQIVFLSFLAFIYLDVIFLGTSNLALVFFPLVAWVVCIQIMKLNRNLSYYMVLSLILIWLSVVYFGVGKYTDSLSIWTYAFLSIGVGWDVFDNLLSNE